MSLPDVGHLAALAPEEWRAMAERLREIGLTAAYLRPITRVCEELLPALRPPLRAWHLRRLDEPAALAARMLAFADPVTRAEARAALGKLLDGLLRSRLVVRCGDGRLVSPFLLNLVNDLFVFSDELAAGGASVMGAGETTADLCQASYPTRPIERALDLGCGAGTVALFLAERVGSIVGVDVNPRAIALSRLNAALNGIENVEFRCGDLFAPVEGEEFDLVVSQPPFVSLPNGFDAVTYLHGGRRGDELPRSVLAALPPHLRSGGRAILLVEWPIADGQPLEDQVRHALGSAELSILLLRRPRRDLDNYAALYAAGSGGFGDGDFPDRAQRIRAHLDALGVAGLQPTYTVLERSATARPWAAGQDLSRESARSVTAGRIDRLIAARDLLSTGDDALLAATLRFPAGAVFAKETGPQRPDESSLHVRFPPEALAWPTRLNSQALLLITLVNEARDVRSAVEAFAARVGAVADDGSILAGVREALLSGLLEPRSSTEPG